MRDLNELDYQSLSLGGLDGGIYTPAAAITGKKYHILQVMVDSCTFSVLTGISQAGVSYNMLTTNGLTGVAFERGDLIYAPWGGFITAFTADKAVRCFTLPTTNRKRCETIPAP